MRDAEELFKKEGLEKAGHKFVKIKLVKDWVDRSKIKRHNNLETQNYFRCARCRLPVQRLRATKKREGQAPKCQ